MNISSKYWRHHKKRAMVLLGTIIVSTMAMTIGVFLARSASQGNIEKILTACGNYDLITLPIEEKQLETIAQNDQIAEYGIILNGGLCQTQYSKAVPFGAFDTEQAQEMFHYVPEKGGRYPAAPGEVCGYRETFHALSIAPVLGNHFTLELYDVQGNYAGEREFTIVGILNEADSYYGEIRSLENSFGAWTENGFRFFSEEETDLPEMFFSSEDLPDVCTMSAMIRCMPDALPAGRQECVAGKLAEQGIETWNPQPERLSMISDEVHADYPLTENEMYDKAYLSYNDFYSSILIPVFLGIVLLVSFVSAYAVMADAMKERRRQFGLYRSMGMSNREVRKRLLGEVFFFDVVGVAVGYGLGLILYLFYLQICNAASDAYVYSAFGAHPVARAVSLSPYVWPWLLGFLFSAVALAVPVFFSMRLSPNEMLSPEKAASPSRRHEKGSPYGRILCKVTGKKLSGNRPVAFLIFITGWTFVFGAAFMMAKADNDNYMLYQQLDVSEGVGTDYVARKDLYDTMWSSVLFNRHNEGISAEDMEELAASGDVASVRGVIQLPGLKVFCSASNLSEEQKDALSPLNIENNRHSDLDFLQELFEKSKAAQGYDKDDLLYRVPSVAIDADFLQSLSPYVREGELDMTGLSDGREIVIVEYPDAELSNPFSVGDRISFTDVVITDPYVETWDFSQNTMPTGYEPTFYYDYTDKSMTDIPGYSFGTKVVFDAQVCAVLQIDDENLQKMFDSESYVLTCSSPGYEILCCTDALPIWGLPDRCYTDVYVDLTPDADVDRFEFLWYRIVGKSGKVDSISKMDVKQRIARTDRSNLILFASMILLVIFTGCFGMINAYHFAVNRNMRNLQIIRAVGISKKALVFSHIRELFLCPLWAIVTSLLPVTVFDLVKRYANYYAFELGNQSYILGDNGIWTGNWALRFPFYIELWEQPIPLIMTVAFLCLVLLNIAVTVSPLRQIRKANIVDGIRTDDF